MDPSVPPDDQLDQVLAEILQCQSGGGTIDPDSIISKHPQYADEIRAFLSNQRHFAVGTTTNAFTSIDSSRSPRIGNFKLLQRLGEGGMGEVWMADQEKPVRRRVAIKLVKPGMDSRAVLARFDAERQALALMNHPNIAKVFEAGIVGEGDQGVGAGRPYFVMELVKGIPITDFCDERRLPIQDRLELFRQSCSAVHHAHQKGIIHRDLKPSNILVESHDDRPVLKIIDFGLAKAIGGTQLTEQTLFTALGAIAGTPLYMAPEQAVLNAIDIDIRADVYSLGVLLYELLTGSTPLTKDSLHKKGMDELMKLIRDHEPPKPSLRLSTSTALPSIAAMRQAEPMRLGKFVRGELDWIVMKALSKERERRYGSAMAFSEDIERFLNKEPVEASPPSTLYMFRKFISRNRGFALATASVTGALGIGLIGTTLSFLRAQHVANLERQAKQESIIARDEAVVARKAAEWEAYIANISLIQSAIENHDYQTAKKRLQACPENLRGFEWEFLERQTSSVVGVLPESAVDDWDSTYPMQISNDETKVLVHLDKFSLQVFDLTGEPISDVIVHPDTVKTASFSPDAKKIVTNCYDGKVRIWSIGEPESPTTVYESKFNKSEWFLDVFVSTKIPAIVIDDETEVTVYNFDGKRISEGLVNGFFLGISPDQRSASTYSDNSVFLINLDSGRTSRIMIGRGDSTEYIFHAHGLYLGVHYPQGQNCVQLFQSNGMNAGNFRGDIVISPDGITLYQIRGGEDLLTTWKLHDGRQEKVGESRETFESAYFDSGRNTAFNRSNLLFSDETDSVLRVSIWDSNGQKIKESTALLPRSDSYPGNFIQYCSEHDRVVLNSSADHFRILNGLNLEPICFPIFGDFDESSWNSREFKFPVLKDLVIDPSRSTATYPSIALWDESGTKIGEYYRSHDSMIQLHEVNRALIDNAVVDLNKLDNGITRVSDSVNNAVEIQALLDACNTSNPSRTHKNDQDQFISVRSAQYKIVVSRKNAQDVEITTTTQTPVASLSLPQGRLFIADGKNLRVFELSEIREVASFRQAKNIISLEASNDGKCVILRFKDGSALAWDLRSFAEKQAFWRACASEFQPAKKYVENLLDSSKSFDGLLEACLRDKSLSPTRKWGVVRLLEDAIALDQSLGWKLLLGIKGECLHSLSLTREKLESTSAGDAARLRQIEYAQREIAKLKADSAKISQSCRPILLRSDLPIEEYRRAMRASQEAYSTSPSYLVALARMAESHYRLGENDKAIEFLNRVLKDAEADSELKQEATLFLAMCQFKVGDAQLASELLKQVVLHEKADKYTQSLYAEAHALIEGK